MKKVGIVYICRGRYILFWKDFYLSCEKHFFPKEGEKHYFVFTDGVVYDEENPRVHVYPIKKEFDVSGLLRPDMFLKAETKLKEMDYVYFFNANLKFVKDIGIEYFPASPDELVVIPHSFVIKKRRKVDFPYEKNTDSLVFVSDNDNIIYIAGEGNGASSELFLKLVKETTIRTQEVLSKEIVVTFHNDFHPNRYILNSEVRIIPQK
ncbi:hypothetical protein FACS1894174_04210 [Bacteroidia bacterium]|nr:hypothetical protein FACS1894174_04210 [Bacteroidia bacterium]